MSVRENSILGREYVEHWLGYGSYVGRRTFDAWASFARRGSYRQPSDLLEIYSEWMDYWVDVGAASMAAARGVDRRGALVVFQIDANDTDIRHQFVPIFTPAIPKDSPQIHWLGPLEGNGQGTRRRLDKSSLRVQLGEHRMGLDIYLLPGNPELDPQDPTQSQLESSRLAVVVYRALVVVEEVPIAEVLIDVSDGDPDSQAHSASGSSRRE